MNDETKSLGMEPVTTSEPCEVIPPRRGDEPLRECGKPSTHYFEVWRQGKLRRAFLCSFHAEFCSQSADIKKIGGGE